MTGEADRNRGAPIRPNATETSVIWLGVIGVSASQREIAIEIGPLHMACHEAICVLDQRPQQPAARLRKFGWFGDQHGGGRFGQGTGSLKAGSQALFKIAEIASVGQIFDSFVCACCVDYRNAPRQMSPAAHRQIGFGGGFEPADIDECDGRCGDQPAGRFLANGSRAGGACNGRAADVADDHGPRVAGSPRRQCGSLPQRQAEQTRIQADRGMMRRSGKQVEHRPIVAYRHARWFGGLGAFGGHAPGL